MEGRVEVIDAVCATQRLSGDGSEVSFEDLSAGLRSKRRSKIKNTDARTRVAYDQCDVLLVCTSCAQDRTVEISLSAHGRNEDDRCWRRQE